MKKGAVGWTTGMNVFPPVEFAVANFVSSIVLGTAKDPIGPAIRCMLKPHQGPSQVSLCQDILFSI